MKNLVMASVLVIGMTLNALACDSCARYGGTDFAIESASVTHHEELGILVWEITVTGEAGRTIPEPVGQLHGAPVLGYVFPTTLNTTDVGFNETEGIVALALTSHPDFDDTPLWDESSDGHYNNDGAVWHPHWVVLVHDDRVNGGFSVKEFASDDDIVVLPPTNPGMPMYMDSPGFGVVTRGNAIRAVVPLYRVKNRTDFSFDAVTCYMQVNTGGADDEHVNGELPMLGVYKVYGVASGDMSLPYTVK